MALDSQSTKPPSEIVGTRPLGFNRRYSGSLLPPNGPPTSTRLYGTSSSSQHHRTFWTFIELLRPQIRSTHPPSIWLGSHVTRPGKRARTTIPSARTPT